MRIETSIDTGPWLEKLERAACFSDEALAERLEALKSESALALPVLDKPMLKDLADAASRLPYRATQREVGKPEARVYQELGYCDSIPGDHPIAHLGRWLQWRLRRALALMPEPPVARDFHINDVVCQEYREGDLGITPHRDHVAYTGVIVLVVLSGSGRYYVCDDRRGGGRRDLPSSPGQAILMPGPGYAGRSDRPFHAVGDITGTRYSVGLRHDKRKKSGERALRSDYPQNL